jgi:hypothetical protein
MAERFGEAGPGPAERLRIEQIAALLDRIDEYEAKVRQDGPMIEGQRGIQKSHPLIAEVRQLRQTVGRMLRDLDPEPESITTIRARRAADARWNREGSQTRQRAAAIDPVKKRQAALHVNGG